MTAMFGQAVIVAELPPRLQQLAPNETRSVEASFRRSGLNTGPIVQGVFPGYAAHQQPHSEACVPTATPAPGRKVGHGKKNKHHPVHTSGKQT